jgi:hypothetical protein
MPSRKTKPNKVTTRRRRSRRPEHEVVVEETTRVVPARRRIVAVRQEPVTLSRALGEAAVVESTAEPPVTSKTVVRRKRA